MGQTRRLSRAATAFALFAVAALSGSSGVQALDFRPRETAAGVVLVATGSFVAGDADRLRAALDAVRNRASTVSFMSPGGRLGEGFRVGELIRERKLATLIEDGASCASACVFAFAGGVVREVRPRGRIGVHMATLSETDGYILALRRILLMTEVSLDERIRFIVALNEQMGAAAMSAQARYFQSMGISLRILTEIANTDSDGIKWLSRQELRQFNVANVD